MNGCAGCGPDTGWSDVSAAGGSVPGTAYADARPCGGPSAEGEGCGRFDNPRLGVP